MSAIVPINQEIEIPDEYPDDENLTWQERMFVDAYTGEARGNATRAAQIAGYGSTYDSQRQLGYRLLTKVHVAASIRARARAVMSEHETIDELAHFIRGGITHPMERNAWVKGIELMMRYHGVLADKIEHSGTVSQEIKQIVVTYAAQQEPSEPPTQQDIERVKAVIDQEKIEERLDG